MMNQSRHVTFFDDKGSPIAVLDVSVVNNAAVQREWSSRPPVWPITEGQVNQVVSHLQERIDHGTVAIGQREYQWQAD
jgi:hypothetical protein